MRSAQLVTSGRYAKTMVPQNYAASSDGFMTAAQSNSTFAWHANDSSAATAPPALRPPPARLPMHGTRQVPHPFSAPPLEIELGSLTLAAGLTLGVLEKAYADLIAIEPNALAASVSVTPGREDKKKFVQVEVADRAEDRQLGLTIQGNRVKESCGEEACEEVVVPGGGFSLKAQ